MCQTYYDYFCSIEKAEEILNNSGAKIKHKAQDRAYYSPVTDTITLPLKEQFVNSVLCHFLILIHFLK